MEIEWYVLFPNHENGLRLYKCLKQQKIHAIIVPTPRTLSKSCGISLKILEEEKGEVERLAILEQVKYIGIECLVKTEHEKRDKYC